MLKFIIQFSDSVFLGGLKNHMFSGVARVDIACVYSVKDAVSFDDRELADLQCELLKLALPFISCEVVAKSKRHFSS